MDSIFFTIPEVFEPLEGKKHIENWFYYTQKQKRKSNITKYRVNDDASRFLEKSLGDGEKKIELNEKESIIVQRRGVWVKKKIKKGERLKRSHIEILRPCPKNSISPFNS